MIARSHSSPLGTDACVRRSHDVIFWPSMASDIREKVQSCDICNDYKANNQKEPLMTHLLPDTPWGKSCSGSVQATWRELSSYSRLLR